MTLDKRFEILLWQYRECLSNMRTRITTIWQLPSISMAINSFLGITYLGYAKTFPARLVVLLASLFFTFILTIEYWKHRFKLDAAYTDFKWIQNQLCKLEKEDEGIRKIKLLTHEIQSDIEGYADVPRNWWTQQRATKWFLRSMYVTMFVISLLLAYEVKDS